MCEYWFDLGSKGKKNTHTDIKVNLGWSYCISGAITELMLIFLGAVIVE